MDDVNIPGEGAVPARPKAEPNVHGQVALLLVESLIHGLIERSVISTADALDIVDTAEEVRIDIAQETGEAPEQVQPAMVLIQSIKQSIGLDLKA